MDYFLEEILSQPQVLRATLDRYAGDDSLLQSVAGLIDRAGHELVLFTGMGSSYFALYPACIYCNEHGLPAMMIETSELLHYYRGLVTGRALTVMVSQSGETVEVKRLLDQVRGSTPVVSLTNDAGSYVARNSDVSLVLHAGPERGPASKTHTTAVSILLLLAVCLTRGVDDRLVSGLYTAVGAMESFLGHWKEKVDAAFDFLGTVDSLALLGRGPSMTSAMAGALVLKEAAKMQAEGMSGGQFRHGPLEAVSPGFAAVVFATQGRTRDIDLRLAGDIARFGGKVVAVGCGEELRGERILNLTLPPLEPTCSPLLEVLPMQLLSWRIAREKGLQPGRFEKAEKVTRHE